MTKNMMERIYMNGADYRQYLIGRRPEFQRFMSDIGLLKKKKK